MAWTIRCKKEIRKKERKVKREKEKQKVPVEASSCNIFSRNRKTSFTYQSNTVKEEVEEY